MFNLYFLKWNSYYNRTYKPLLSVNEAEIVGVIENCSNWNPNDGVDAEQVTAYNTFVKIPDYMAVVEDGKITSRWYVIECVRTRNGQFKVSLHRDLIADYYESIKDSPMFVEKGFLSASSPLIFNKENMTFNQIKKGEYLLDEGINCAWIVGYLARPQTGKEQDISGSVSFGTPQYDYEIISNGSITSWEYYKYSNLASNRVPLYQGHSEDRFGICTHENGSQGYLYIIDSEGDMKVDYKYPNSSTITAFKSGIGSRLRKSFNSTYKAQLTSQVSSELGLKTLSYVNSLRDFDGKIIKSNEGTTKYWRVSVRSEVTEITHSVTAGAMYNTYVDWVTPEIETGTPNEDSFKLIAYVNNFTVNLEDITPRVGQASFTISKTRTHLIDAPYDMFAIPCPVNRSASVTVTKGAEVYTYTQDFSMSLAMSIIYQGQTNVYDIQLLPYNPVIGLNRKSNGNLSCGSGMSELDFTYVKQGDTNVAVIFNCRQSKFSKIISTTNRLPDSVVFDESNPIEKKVKNECSFLRICSPSGSNSFDFSPMMNKGLTSFTIDCTYKPYTPYIRVCPTFSGLYGKDYGDTRGLIVQGDFSLPVLTSEWKQYEINNKNYSNVFERENQSLALQHEKRMIQQKVAVAAGVAGAGLQAVGSVSAGFGVGGGLAAGAVGGGLSLAAGIADINISKELYNENMSYRRDMFGMNLENIQARPQGLARTSAFTNNNKVFPFVELYDATDEEKEALRNKIKYNGMTVGVIGTLYNYIYNAQVSDETTHYVKGQLIVTDIDDDYHSYQALNNELDMGIRFPVGG